MSVKRIFQGRDGHALPKAVEWLINGVRSGNFVDLHGTVVVLPGGRAGRRFNELFLARVSDLGLGFFPPEITTVGKLPELLYTPQRPFASELVQDLAWAKAIRKWDREEVCEVIPRLPDDEGYQQWLELGRLMRRQHRELAGDQLDFADVAERGEVIDGFQESRRWRILAGVQQLYLSILNGLGLWDRQTARLVAIERRECRIDGQVILIGTADMNRTLRQMLGQIAEHVVALVLAPDQWSDRFDEFGCVIPSAWEGVELDLDDRQIFSADSPAEQAEEVVRWIADLEGQFSANEITIGLPDESLVNQIRLRLDQASVPTRWGPGRRAAEIGPVRLLSAVADYLETKRYHELANLVHHPDILNWLRANNIDEDCLTDLDAFFNQRLPTRVIVPPHSGSRLCRMTSAIDGLLAQLFHNEEDLASCAYRIVDLLTHIYGDRQYNLDDPVDKAIVTVCQIIQKSALTLADVPDKLAPRVSAATAIQLVLRDVESADVASPANQDAIELLGWLELPLDDAPASVVTSFNEGYVPTFVNSDLFLPNTLRMCLGLDDNSRRYARDAYALSVLTGARQSLRLIVGRHDREGNPLAPSRLLFAADPPTIAKRTLRLLESDATRESSFAKTAAQPMLVASLRIPRPIPLEEPITRLSPTAIRDYLTCPYRFYLRHVLRLKDVSDDASEMDGRTFGSLLHEVLHRFGTSPVRDSTDVNEIGEYLNGELTERVEYRFGSDSLATIRIQVEQMRIRLDAFAKIQAERAAKGWRIEMTEVPSANSGQAVLFEVDDQPITLTGRIDRIDAHAETGERVIFDYKSGDKGEHPETSHRKRGDWVDLQLPLYRHIAKSLGINGPAKFGYVLLPKDSDKTTFQIAEWTEADLESADKRARDVVRCIRREQFWPPRELPSAHVDEFASICQQGVLDRERVETGAHEPLTSCNKETGMAP